MVLKENVTRSTELHDFHLASRKAEEAALRRYQAVHWLECLVGPLGISDQPSEGEFISCLRNGLILCNAINKIQPGSVPKVVDSHLPLQSAIWDSQPLPAYQYFENVRNFLVAVEELKLPAFEASDLARETFEAGSVARIVDCILALKSYHELKQINWGNGSNKNVKSPLPLHSASKNFSRPSNALSTDPCRRLDMSMGFTKESHEDYIVKALTDVMVDTKENIDNNFLAFHVRNLDPVKALSKILGSCLEEQLQNKSPELTSSSQDILREKTHSVVQSASVSKGNRPANNVAELRCRACFTKGTCEHWHLLQRQEKDLSDIKFLLSRTKKEFEDLQAQLFNDLKQLGSQVQEMSTAALGYQKVVQENRYLYNMVQDLKGSIRVYCRIRLSFNGKERDVIDFIGEDGSLVIADPLKKDGRKVFQFNHVYGPTATQDEVFKDAQPLIRSVMDGYNVCILAYGQTGSGKTYTMCGPSGGVTKEMGINYLALNDLFHMSDQRKDIISYDIYVQMVEIYNEQVRDLLVKDSSSTKLEIRSHHSNDGLSIPDATLHPVKSTVDVLNLMKLGDQNRAVSFTAMNNQSSRSHSVLTVHVHGKDTSGNILHSRLYLVDLAGSERVDKSEVTGDRLKETQHINKSLSCLGDVFTALSQKSSYIPYRNSKLTLLLQDALGGHAKTLMFAHVSPEGENFGETLSTLKFAQRVSTVELGAACLNKQSSEVRELRQQIENLKKALLSKEAQNSQVIRQHTTSPHKKAKVTTQRTPPRPRRLSIESSWSVMNSEKVQKAVMEATPLQSQMMSIEHSCPAKTEKVQNAGPGKPKEPRTPCEKPKVMLEQTLPKPPRLSIGNSQTMNHEGLQNEESDILKEDNSSCEERTGRTPPKSRRLSIENSGSTKSRQTSHERTVPSSQRLSIENSRTMKVEKVQCAESGKTRELKSPRGDKMGMSERTPQSRLLKLENLSGIKSDKVVNNAANKRSYKTPSLAAKNENEPSSSRVRRLSLGAAKNGVKDHLQIALPEDVCEFSPLGSVALHQYPEIQEAQVASDSNADFSNSRSPVGSGDQAEPTFAGQATEIPAMKPPNSPKPQLFSRNYRQTALHCEVSKDHQTTIRAKSPPSSAHQRQPNLAGYATKIPTIKAPKSPEQQRFSSKDYQTPITAKSTQRKGSQIRKSLRTIGKLINGSDRRSQQKTEAPTKGRNIISDPKSPDQTNARALRRQSLTGIPSAGSDHLRRSSLGNGGNSKSTYETRNAKSPISARSSTKVTERWM